MRRTWIALLLAGFGLGLGLAPALAQPSYYEAVDVPTELPTGSGADFLPWQLVRNDAGVYTSSLNLPVQASLDALHRRGSGRWLLSLDAAADLGGNTYEARDVVQWDGAAVFIPFILGGPAGIPAGSNLDAVFLDPNTGDPIVSFDVPTTIGAFTFQPADLARLGGGGFVLYFDATVAGIPDSVNLTAAAHKGGRLVFSLDIPTTVGPTYLPGQLLGWDGVVLSLWDAQPGWPGRRTSRVNALTFLADPGTIGTTLRVEHAGAGLLRLRWNSSVCAGGQDYGIYEGNLGAFYSHALLLCTDSAPFLEETIAAPAANTYYLVVPHNDIGGLNPTFNEEGSYGRFRNGPVTGERPPAPPPQACVQNQTLGCSP